MFVNIAFSFKDKNIKEEIPVENSSEFCQTFIYELSSESANKITNWFEEASKIENANYDKEK